MTERPALINLVRTSSIATTEGLDVEAAATIYSHPDEIELVTPGGDPCAIPDDAWIDSDYEHEYVNGGLGFTSRRRRHRIAMAIDYIGSETQAKLQRWMHDRATVYVAPGYGRYTDLAYRPIAGAGNVSDLTGRYTLATAGPASAYWWDPWYKAMRGAYTGTNPRVVVWTPYGNGQVGVRALENRYVPGTPASATEGFAGAGWRKAGTHSADITLTLVTGGFGHDDAPHSLRVVTTNGTSRTRSLLAQTLWDSGSGDYQGYTFSGAGRATAVVKVKGRPAAGTTLTFGVSTDVQTVTLSEYDLSDWTPVYLSVYSANWAAAIPYLKIDMASGASADRDDFEVGAIAVYHASGAYMPERPEWLPSETATGAAYQSLASYRTPASGSMVCAFYCPPGYSGPSSNVAVGLIGGSTKLWIGNGPVAYWESGATPQVYGDITLDEGAVNVLSATWGNGTRSLYFNGDLIASAAASAQDMATESTATLYIGSNGTDMGCHPLLLLSARIDRRVFTDNQMADLCKGLLDPVANAIAVRARGRSYVIRQIPSTPRNSAVGTHWIGRLELEETAWASGSADLASTEVM